MSVRHAIVAAITLSVALVLGGCATSPTSSVASDDGSSSGSEASSVSASSDSTSLSSSSVPDQQTLSSVNSSVEVPRADSVLPEDKWGNYFTTCGDEVVEFGRRVQSEVPAKAYISWLGEGGGTGVETTDPAEIRALFNALASSNVIGETNTMWTDDSSGFGFQFSDGSSFGFNFEGMAFGVDDKAANIYRFYELDPSPELSQFRQIAYDASNPRDS